MRKSSQNVALVVVAPLMLLLVATLSACQVPDPFVAGGHSSSISVSTAIPWPRFTDRGNDGFTISYPPSWKAAPSGLNDVMLRNVATDTMLEVKVTTAQQSPAAVLAQQQPSAADQAQRNMTVTQRMIANHPAVDVFIPYYHVPTPVVPMPNSGIPGIAGGRVIVMAAANSAGTTNVYTFIVNYTVDSAANITPASLGDNPALLQILSTFQLPPTIDPVVTR